MGGGRWGVEPGRGLSGGGPEGLGEWVRDLASVRHPNALARRDGGGTPPLRHT